MLLGCIITLTPIINHYLLLLMQKYHGGLGNKISSHLIQHKILFVHENKEKRKIISDQNLSSKMDMEPKILK